jgi:adenylate cyclase
VITVLFSDIRGFTSWSETRRPEEVVAQLNEYLSAMADVVADHGGYVDKFIGDAVMALWSVPIEQPDHADRGLATAREMLRRLDLLNQDWKTRGLEPFKIGIGLHSGEALVGNLGSDRKADYTAIGDTVNTASRLESMTKELGASPAISVDCASLLGERPPDLRPLGSVPIRGREAGVEIFTLKT